MNSRYFLSMALAFVFAAGCGQKGPLYLPGNPSEIKTVVPPEGQSEAPEDDEDEEEKESQDE